MENIKIKLQAEIDQDSIKEIDNQINGLEEKLHNIKVKFKIGNTINNEMDNIDKKLKELNTQDNVNKYPTAKEVKEKYKDKKIELWTKHVDDIFEAINYYAKVGYTTTRPIKLLATNNYQSFDNEQYAEILTSWFREKGYYITFNEITESYAILTISWK